MDDSEVRQKFEATERERKRILGIWTQEIVEQMRHNFQGHHIPHSAVRLWLDRTWDEAYSAGMRAGEIAMKEKAAKICDAGFEECTSRPNCHSLDAELIRKLAISGAEESKKEKP